MSQVSPGSTWTKSGSFSLTSTATIQIKLISISWNEAHLANNDSTVNKPRTTLSTSPVRLKILKRGLWYFENFRLADFSRKPAMYFSLEIWRIFHKGVSWRFFELNFPKKLEYCKEDITRVFMPAFIKKKFQIPYLFFDEFGTFYRPLLNLWVEWVTSVSESIVYREWGLSS